MPASPRSRKKPQQPAIPVETVVVEQLPPPVVVTRGNHMQEMLGKLRKASVVAVDTESDSLFAYHYKVCLLQISVAEGEDIIDYIVDPLALCDVTPLGSIFANPNIQKVFHAAENDVIALKRDYDFAFTNIFDTLGAARILGWQNRNLAAVLQARFGVKMDKRMQRANWGQRPLTSRQLAYARLDSRYLLPLRELQMQELQERKRLAEALEAFKAISSVEWEERPFDPNGFWRLSGAKELDGRQLAVLRELYIWREERAQQLDRPLFKVMGDKVLVSIATVQPSGTQPLERVQGVSRNQARWHGPGILAAIERGQHAPPPSQPTTKRKRRKKPFNSAAQERFEALRTWRNDRAAQRGVDPDVVLANEELKAIAVERPRTMEQLADLGIMGPWKVKTYGAEILETLAG